MNDLQQKKLARLFSMLDRDHDGELEGSDYVAIGAQVAAQRGVAPGSIEHKQMHERMVAYWDALAQRADKDSNGRITSNEWAQSMSMGSESMQQARGMMVALAATLLDRDGDGSITADDYQNLFAQLGLTLTDADKVFRNLDRNGDGKIDTAELATLVDEFLFSDDPNASGNWLLGAL